MSCRNMSFFIEHLRKTNRTNSHFSQISPQTRLYVSAITVYELLAGAYDAGKVQDANLLLSATTIITTSFKYALLNCSFNAAI